MIRKINLVIICLIMLLIFVYGCSSGEGNSNELLIKKCNIYEEYFYVSGDFLCEEMQDITYSGTTFFITKDGLLYEYSERKYSTTNSNCKRIETDVVFDKIVRNTLIDKDGNLYLLDSDKNLILITKELEDKGPAYYGLNSMDIPLYREYNDMFYLGDNPSVSNGITYSGLVFGVIEDKNVYSLYSSYGGADAVKELIHTFDDEEIEKVNNGYIRTNKGYYKYGIVNNEECAKYEDIECRYGLVKVDTKDNCSNVIYAGKDIVVTEDMVK